MTLETPKIPFNEESLSDKITELYDSAIDEYIEEHNDEDSFEEWLNDSYGEIEICGSTFSAGHAYRELDPVGFRCGNADNEDSVREQAEQEISEDDFRDEALEALNMEEEEIG